MKFGSQFTMFKTALLKVCSKCCTDQSVVKRKITKNISWMHFPLNLGVVVVGFKSFILATDTDRLSCNLIG